MKCFKYLLLNKCGITEKTLYFSIAGGNQEIINILKEKSNKFEEYLLTSVLYHRYELTNWLNENYKCKPVPLPKCIKYYNIDAFLYFLEHGHSLDETEEYDGYTCLHSASEIGSLSIVQYLIEKGANIEATDGVKQTPLYVASLRGKTDIVKYLISKGANKNAKDIDGKTPYDNACNWGTVSQRDIITEILK